MPATDDLEDLFGIETLTSMVQRFAEPVDNRIFTSLFREGEQLMPQGESAIWDEVRYSRDLAPTTGMDSPTESAPKTDRTVRSAVMVDVKEHVDLPTRFLHLQRAPGSNMDDARAQLAIELENATQRVMNSIEYICAQALQGTLDFSLMPNSKLAHSVSYPVNALAALADWATAGTKIRSSEIPTLKSDFRKKAGMRPARVISTPTVEGHLTANTEIQTFAQHLFGAEVLRGAPLEGTAWDALNLGGLRWNFTDGHHARAATPDTTVQFLADDKAIVLPSQLRGVLAMAEGRSHIPAGPVFSGAEAALSMFREVRGMWAYAEIISNPPGIRIHVGWRGLPIVKLVNGVMVFDVTP